MKTTCDTFHKLFSAYFVIEIAVYHHKHLCYKLEIWALNFNTSPQLN